jgi:prolyl-tRNA synthetase
MRYSNFFIPTHREIPADADAVSHQLMIRAGLIRKLTSGIYTYLPAGVQSLKKVECIIREEMNRAGAVEILTPAVQPAELWQESGRWNSYGRELLRFRDRHNKDVCFGPASEEIITDLVRNEVQSYRQLPVRFYQIQTRFRDEMHPRSGIMKSRESLMNEAYSFDVDEDSARVSCERMHQAYTRIFQRCGLQFKAAETDTGSVARSCSHQFVVLVESGEEQIAGCLKCNYAANLENAEIRGLDSADSSAPAAMLELEEIHTPDIRTIDELAAFLSVSSKDLIKTLIYRVDDNEIVAALVRGDHELNEAKFRNLLAADTVEMADPGTVHEVTGAPTGFAGPMGLHVRLVADRSIQTMRNFVTGANRVDYHVKNVNCDRDFTVERFGDIRTITLRDRCPRCGGEIEFRRGIEVGHITEPGTRYSHAMDAVFLDEQGRKQHTVMGCYGIDVGKTVAAAIEQHHDEDGIIFPIQIAPFEVIILPLQMHESMVLDAAEQIYSSLLEKGVEVLLDDRNERAGIKFMDADLLGIPLRVTVGTRGVKNGEVEVKMRAGKEPRSVSIPDAAGFIMKQVHLLYDSTE